jgi:SAM-dependent methyltransferase
MTQPSKDRSAASWPQWHCPTHRAPLLTTDDVLVCPADPEELYPIIDGIPRFVIGERYTAAFGAQWNKYRTTQLDSHSGTTITEARTHRLIGDELWSSLSDRHVAELGCGAGRFTEILLRRGARVTSVDLSSAVEANADNFPPSESHRIAQADLLRLPFDTREFDVVFCVGVIQHTPSPEATIRSIYEHVKPGGHLVIDHAGHSFSGWYSRTSPLFRLWLRRLEPSRGMRVTEELVRVLLPLHKRVAPVRPARVLLKRISPVISFYEVFPELEDELQREWALLDTHDSLTAWHRHARTRNQVLSLLQSLGVEDIWSTKGGLGVEARGRRPAARSSATA